MCMIFGNLQVQLNVCCLDSLFYENSQARPIKGNDHMLFGGCPVLIVLPTSLYDNKADTKINDSDTW